MEILRDEPINLERVANLLHAGIRRRSPSSPRDLTTWHVTNLLRSAQLIAKGDIRYWEGDGVPSGIMSMGRIWEAVMDCYLQDYAVQHEGVYLPDIEMEKDGVLGSLDGLMCLPDLGWLVCETKLRFTQNSEIPLDHLQQVRAYCHLAGANLACYVSGHLSSSPPMVTARLRVIRPTQLSIGECWQGIVNTKEYLITRGRGPKGNRGG